MDGALVATAALMGLGGAWHCALMCGPLVSCGTGAAGKRQTLWWLMGRTVGYTAVGAALASAASWGSNFVLRGGAGPLSPWLSVWALAHAAALSLGVFLLWQGRQPLWLATLGQRSVTTSPAVVWVGRQPSGWPLAAGGLAWAALPCGLLQSAWVVAALAPSAWAGAASMAAFSLASAPGVLLGPALLAAWRRRPASAAVDWRSRLTRLSGLLLCLASGWALGHGLWVHMRDFC